MSVRPAWLPEELHYSDYNGDWERFLSDVYTVFEQDFKRSKPIYQSIPITYDDNMVDGKEAVFWHIIQKEDTLTGLRVTDLRRCECIPWPRPLIENPADSAISIWENTRNRQTRILIWAEQLNYLVVLARMPKVMVLVTAYCTDFEYRRKQLIKERDEYRNKMQKPPL